MEHHCMDVRHKIKSQTITSHIRVRKTEEDYLKNLLGNHIKEGDIIATFKEGKFHETIEFLKLKEAYNKAHDIRKFEIDLYWKRANHFWLFMTALAGVSGFGISSSNIWFNFCTPALITVGLIFGLGFHFANKGSKY